MNIDSSQIFDKDGKIILPEKVMAYLEQHFPAAVRSIKRIAARRELFEREDSVICGHVTLYIPSAKSIKFDTLENLTRYAEFAPAPTANFVNFETRVGTVVKKPVSAHTTVPQTVAPSAPVQHTAPAPVSKPVEDNAEIDEDDIEWLNLHSPDEIIVAATENIIELVTQQNEKSIPVLSDIIIEYGNNEHAGLNFKDLNWIYKFGFNTVKDVYNNVVDKEVLIDRLAREIQLGYQRADMTKRKYANGQIDKSMWNIIARVFCRMACNEYLLEWHNIVMTRKGYNRIVKVTLDMEQLIRANQLGVGYRNGLSLPNRWSI